MAKSKKVRHFPLAENHHSSASQYKRTGPLHETLPAGHLVFNVPIQLPTQHNRERQRKQQAQDIHNNVFRPKIKYQSADSDAHAKVSQENTIGRTGQYLYLSRFKFWNFLAIGGLIESQEHGSHQSKQQSDSRLIGHRQSASEKDQKTQGLMTDFEISIAPATDTQAQAVSAEKIAAPNFTEWI